MLHKFKPLNCRVAFVALAGLLATSSVVAQQPRPYQLPREDVHRFAIGLQAAVNAGNLQQVADHIQFPLRVNTARGNFYFVRREDFPADYAKIFTAELRAAIRKQDMSALEQSAGDISIGDGMVTATGVCSDRGCATLAPRVTTIDVRTP